MISETTRYVWLPLASDLLRDKLRTRLTSWLNILRDWFEVWIKTRREEQIKKTIITTSLVIHFTHSVFQKNYIFTIYPADTLDGLMPLHKKKILDDTTYKCKSTNI